MTARTPFVLLAVLVTAGCVPGDGPVCPASLEIVSPNVVVEVDEWPAAASVVLECSSGCTLGLDGTTTAQLTAPVDDGAAGFDLTADPDSLVVTVLAADGAELAAVEVELQWVRVGGTEDCGGPVRATVTVPGP